jgi:hypothetical protein
MLVLNKVTVEESSFQVMADAAMKEIRATGNALAKQVKAASPVGPRRKKRSKASKLYGTLKSVKTKFVTRGRRVKEYKDGKRKWRFYAERAVLAVPFYGYFIDKGWQAHTGKRSGQPRSRKAGAAGQRPSGGRFVPGTGFVSNTIKGFAR